MAQLPASTPAMKRTHQGFSLIELMTTLAIIAVLTGIALPGFISMVQRMRANALISQFTADVALARMKAIAASRAVTVCPSNDQTRCSDGTDWSQGWLVFKDDDHDLRLDAGEERFSTVHHAAHHISFQTTSGRTTTRYLPDGFASGANFTMTVCIKGAPHAVLVMNNVGRMRVDREHLPSASACPVA